ncbi:hypothetical protein [Roseixanthobacter glucoisosaccharinicivorans]|uniref:hypothetical protein n=1 Tax=Roseixanthobacter glucoisosaccharinicivorans TaxID=3119923 RepID=UPI003726ADAE
MGTTDAGKAGGKVREAFLPRAKFAFAMLGFVSAPASIGMVLRLFGHFTLRSSLVWATLSYPVLIVIGAIVGISMLFRGPVENTSPASTQTMAMETEPDHERDPLVG